MFSAECKTNLLCCSAWLNLSVVWNLLSNWLHPNLGDTFTDAEPCIVTMGSRHTERHLKTRDKAIATSCDYDAPVHNWQIRLYYVYAGTGKYV